MVRKEVIEKAVNMTAEEKEAHIQGVEFTRDYGMHVPDEDKELYDFLVKERKLHQLIDNFHEKLEEARNARSEVMSYLKDEFEIDIEQEYETIERDNVTWCYGIDTCSVEKLISDKYTEEEEA